MHKRVVWNSINIETKDSYACVCDSLRPGSVRKDDDIVIEGIGLTKKYGATIALRDVSFSVGEGEIVGLLGLNGAGKSTTMNILTGYLGATSGTARIAGYDVLRDSRKVRALVGYLPEQPPLYMDMTVDEYLRFVWQIYKKRGDGRARMDRVAEMTGIAKVRGRLIRNLSKGYRQRVGVAQAILPEPKVLILDEPTVGLDPTQIIEMRALIREVARDTTVILSSHILSEVQAVCSRVLVLNQGRLIADDAPERLADLVHGKQRAALRVRGERDAVETALKAIPGVRTVELLGQKELGSVDFLVEGADGRDVRVDAFEALSSAKLPLLYTYGSELSLEEVFLRLIERDREGGA